jgi:tetratricopeptide (TPR) repeat protein
MQVLEKDKKEIEIRASKMSDFLRMEYFETCLRKFTDSEIQKLCCMELAKLYENKHMYPEAVKYIFKFQEITGNPIEKKKAMLIEVELLIKGSYYDKAESVIRKAMSILNEQERFELRRNVIRLYSEIAGRFEKSGKNSELIRIYERLVNYVVDKERIDIKKKMAESLRKIGRIRESMEIDKELERYSPEFEKKSNDERRFVI